MAGDWIKMRGNLWDDPRVSRLVDLTDTSEAAIVGGLYWLWATADQHSEDGVMPGLTMRSIDRKTGIQGFAEALVSIGWLIDSEAGVSIHHFEEHNGASAKSRLMTAKRVAEHKANAKVTVAPLPEKSPSVTEPLPREEKRREEVKTKAKPTRDPAGFASFWSAYPNKAAKLDAEKAFNKIDSALLPAILKSIEGFKKTEKWLDQNGKFIPLPASWLNGKRWEDELTIASNFTPIVPMAVMPDLPHGQKPKGLDLKSLIKHREIA